MQDILDIRHVVKRYAQHTALNDVSIAVPKQSIFGLLGPNGAGKTSLIRIITQITAPDEGEVLLNGEKLNPKHIALVGYLPEERGLYKKMKVGEQLLYLAQLKGLDRKTAVARIKNWLDKFDLQTWWDKKVEDLSKGMQQKVQFIASVIHEPELIILDEPFSGFDPINANLLKDEILNLRKNGCTIIFSTHRMESVEELCDHIALINHSQVVLQGSTRSIKQRYKTHTYLAEGIGKVNPLALEPGFEVLENVSGENNYFYTKIKIPVEKSPNDLLVNLMQQVEIHSFKENIPSMNDIFIKTVNGENNTATKITSGFTE
jgi:ABC-2 type transport system ATP-binding protein